MERAGFLALVLIIAFGMVLPGVGSGMQAGDTLCIEVGEITLKPPEDADSKRSEVDFPHGVHFDYKCQTCHHTWDKGAEILSCQASGCHDLIGTPTEEEGRPEVAFYKEAYHQMCIGCHKEIKKQRIEMENSGRVLKDQLPRTGPTSCIECHPA